MSLFILFAFTLEAQKKYNFSLEVKDADEPLIGATIIVLKKENSLMLSFTITDDSGKAVLKGVPEGIHTLQITYVGYGTFERDLRAEGENVNIDLGTIRLRQDSKIIDGIVITEELVPIKITKDTIEYNADAFKTQPNATVEELLKRLPGVEVEEDGSIRAQGEDVKNVLVNGKEFFGNDPKIATKNLPAEAVKKVQVFDRKSQRAEFTGIDDGNEEKTINLELKPNFSAGKFGNAKLGYGTEHRFETKLAFNQFTSKTQFSLLGNFNNINQQGLEFGDFNQFSGGNFSAGRSLGVLNQGLSNIGEIKSSTVGVNLNHSSSKNTKLNLSYFLTYGDRFLDQTTLSENAIPTGLFYTDEANTSTNINWRHNINTVFEMGIDSTQRVKFTGTFALNSTDLERMNEKMTSLQGNLVVNNSDQSNQATTDGNNINLKLEYNKKFNNRGRSLSFEAIYGNNNSDVISNVDNENLFFGVEGEVISNFRILQRQLSITENINYDGKLSYTEPLGNRTYLTAQIQYTNRNNDRIKDFFDRDPITLQESFNEILSNAFDNTFDFYIAGIDLRKTTNNFNLNAGVNYKTSVLSGIINGEQAVSRNFAFFLPSFNFFLPNTNVRIRYRTAVNEPSINQLQPVVDNSDPLNLIIGNPNLVPEYNHRLNINYILFDNFNFTSLFIFLNGTYTKNAIVNARFVDENFANVSQPFNVSNRMNLRSTISYGRPIRPLKINIRTRFNTTVGRDINLINLKEDFVNRFGQGVSLTFDNRKKDVLDLSLTFSYDYNQNHFTTNTNLNNSFTRLGIRSAVNIFLGKGWSFNTDFNFSSFSQERFGDENTIALWGANISRLFMGNKLQLSIIAFDLMNQNRGITRSALENLVSETISNSIGRYFMITAQYNLQGFSSTSVMDSRMMGIFR